MKKVYLFVTGMFSFVSLVEAQMSTLCPPGRDVCPDGKSCYCSNGDDKTCYNPITHCCHSSIVKKLITSVKVNVSWDISPDALLKPKCSFPRHYFKDYSDSSGGEKDYVYDTPAAPGGPWTVTFNPGICPHVSDVYESIIAIETSGATDCPNRNKQLGWGKVQEYPTKTVIHIPEPGTEKDDLASPPKPKAPIH